MKLGKRLQNIEALVTAQYDHIWDCCCDHGLLGAALLARQAAPTVHFVDVVPKLMQALENKLAHFFPKNTSSTWQVHCMDVSKLRLQEFNGKHLVIIAGVGGDLMTELVSAIYRHNSGVDIDFLLCPVHHQFTLRKQLIQFDFNLLTERLAVENERSYEILLVTTADNSSLKINPVGSLIWCAETEAQVKVAKEYLQKTIAHYERMQLQPQVDVLPILEAYRAVNIVQSA